MQKSACLCVVLEVGVLEKENFKETWSKQKMNKREQARDDHKAGNRKSDSYFRVRDVMCMNFSYDEVLGGGSPFFLTLGTHLIGW